MQKSAHEQLPQIVRDAVAHHSLRQQFEDDLPPPGFVTLIHSHHGPIGKRYDLKGGEAEETVLADLYRGAAYRLPIFDLRDIDAILRGMTPDMALCYGDTGKGQARIVENDKLSRNPGCIARTLEFFKWSSGSSAMMFDCDIPAGKDIDFERFDALMLKAVPWWSEADRLYTYSSSSGIADACGKLLKPYRKFRCRILVNDGRRIAFLALEVHAALWAAGFGEIVLGNADQALDRSLIDMTVYQANRLDFVRPTLGEGLQRIEKEAVLKEGKCRHLDAAGRGIEMRVTEWRRSSPLYREAYRAIKGGRAARIGRRGDEAAAKARKEGRCEKAAREHVERFYGRHELPGDHEIVLSDGETKTVAELLADREKYHGRECCDCLEPGYRGDKRIGLIILKDDSGKDHPRPVIYSHAHGGIVYRLSRRPAGYDIEAALKDLPERTKADGGAPFRPDAIEDLVTLRQQDQAAFEGLMSALKKAGARMNDLRKAIAEAAKHAFAEDEFDALEDDADADARDLTLIEKMNQRYAFVQNRGGRSVIMEETTDAEGRPVLKFRSIYDFLQDEVTVKIIVRSRAGKETAVPIGKWWKEHPRRRTYKSVIFEPGAGKEVGGCFNLWQGFAVKPVKGSWRLIQQHIEQVIAAGNAAHAKYIIRLLAWMLQNPGKVSEVALVLRGGEGCGKGVIGRLMCNLFGRHAQHISNPKLLAGEFSGHLEDCCFIFADEAFWAGDKAGRGQLYALVTEPSIMIHPKGFAPFEAPNRVKLIMASNHDWVVPAGRDARRWCVLDVAETHKGDTAYFRALYAEIENGGGAAMLHDLLALDLGAWHPRDAVPQTDALREQKDHSLSPEEDWLLDLIERGSLLDIGDFEGMPDSVAGDGLFRDLQNSVPKGYRGITHMTLSQLLPKYGINKHHTREGRVWRFPPLTSLRDTWCKQHGERSWDDPAAKWKERDEPQNYANSAAKDFTSQGLDHLAGL